MQSDSTPALPLIDGQVPAYDIRFWGGRRHRHCLVIPVINEGERIQNLLQQIAALGIAQELDVVIIDGGSTDGSLESNRLQNLGVRGCLVKTGAGKLSAQLRCAYAFVLEQGYDGIVTIDGNNKDDPKAIALIVEKLDNAIDFVQASRFLPGGHAENTPASRNLAIRLIHAPMLSLFSGFRWTDTTQGFRGYSRRLLLDPKISVFRDVFSTYELLAYLSYRAPRLGYRCAEIPSTRRYPKGEVPTKIGGFRGNLAILAILLRTCLGQYNPG